MTAGKSDSGDVQTRLMLMSLRGTVCPRSNLRDCCALALGEEGGEGGARASADTMGVGQAFPTRQAPH